MANFHIYPALGGVAKYTGKQRQAPYTCVQSRNFWPVDTRTGATLTATRPPQADITFPQYPVNMLAQLNLPSPTAFGAANGVLYKRTGEGTYSTISSSVGVTTGRAVCAAPFFKQLVIANDGTPLHYDNDTGLLIELVATSGFVPTDCRLAMNFQSCIWLGGSPTDALGPHVFAACAADDVHNWDFSGNTVESAYVSTGDNRGLITEPLTAMLAMTEDQAIIGCEEEVWALAGHPREGGRFARISNQTGILGQNAWAMTPRGLFFMSHDGLMLIGRNDYGNLAATQISKQKIPGDLLNIAFSILNPTVCMSYSSRWNAVYITVRSATNPQSWAYFLDTGAFFEQPLRQYPYVMFPFESLVTEKRCGVWFGGESSLRQFDTDGTETITSSQIIGPVAISSNSMEANINNQGAMIFGSGTTDDNATVEIYTGPTGESAVNRALSRAASAYKYSTTVGSVRRNNRNVYPNRRGAYEVLRLDQTASAARVVFEDYTGNLIKGGTNVDNGLVAPILTPPSAPIEIDTA